MCPGSSLNGALMEASRRPHTATSLRGKYSQLSWRRSSHIEGCSCAKWTNRMARWSVIFRRFGTTSARAFPEPERPTAAHETGAIVPREIRTIPLPDPNTPVHPMPQRDADLDAFLRSLALAWRAGEARPTHRPRKRTPGNWRTRRDPFETTWPRVVQWLEAEQHRTAKEVFERLQREQPGMFLPGQLRTLQRRVKDRRPLADRRLICADPVGPSHGASVLRPTVAVAHERGTEADAA